MTLSWFGSTAQAVGPPGPAWSLKRKKEYVIEQLQEYQSRFSGKTVQVTLQAFGRRLVGNNRQLGWVSDEFEIAATFDNLRLRHQGRTRYVPKDAPLPGKLVRQEVYCDGKQVQEFHYGSRGIRFVNINCHTSPRLSGVVGYEDFIQAIGLGPVAEDGRLCRNVLAEDLSKITAARLEDRPEVGEVLVCKIKFSGGHRAHFFRFEPVCHWVGRELVHNATSRDPRRVVYRVWLEYGERFGHFIPESWGLTSSESTDNGVGEAKGGRNRNVLAVTRQRLKSFELKESVPKSLFRRAVPDGVSVFTDCDEPPPAPVVAQAGWPNAWTIAAGAIAAIFLALATVFAVRKHRATRAGA